MIRRPWSRLQERFEASDLGRAVISAAILITLIVIAAANLPTSNLKAELTRIAEPYIRAVGIEQVWGVFAPDPRRIVRMLEARIEFADGTEETWRPPHGLPFPDSYRDVRWRRWYDAAFQQDFHEPTARWLAERFSTGGRQVVRVELVQRAYDLLPPWEGPARGPLRTTVYYAYDIAGTGDPGE